MGWRWPVWMQRSLPWVLTVSLILLVLGLGFSRMVRADYGHDEDQFIASARLFMDQALLPYRDYPYFHTPYLIFVYAVLFKAFGSYNLLAARLFSTLSAAAALGLVFIIVYHFFHGRGKVMQWFAASGIILLWLPNPLFAATTSLSWNHDFPVFLTLLAFLLCFFSPGHAHKQGWIFCSGMMLGLAVGSRASFLTGLPAFLGALLLYPGVNTFKGKMKVITIFCLGMGLALLPLLPIFAAAPNQFIFGNWQYALLNTIYRENVPVYGPMSLADKFEYLWEFVISQPVNLILMIAWIFFGLLTSIARLWKREQPAFGTILILLIAPMVSIGSFLPTPSWYQYFYAPVPFILLSTAYGLSWLTRSNQQPARWIEVLFALFVILTNLIQPQDYRRIGFLRYPALWRPLVIHQLGEQIAAATGDGRLLTLAPLYGLEGGLDIYPAFASGTFAWRVAPLVESQERRLLGLVSSTELVQYLESKPPAGILVGFDPLLEAPLVAYAQQNGFIWQQITPQLTLWSR